MLLTWLRMLQPKVIDITSASEAEDQGSSSSSDSEGRDRPWDPEHATPYGKGRRRRSRNASERHSLSGGGLVCCFD